MSTFQLTFINKNGGVQPDSHVGDLHFARGVVVLWLGGDDADRICVLEVPSPSQRKRTKFEGNAHVFNREQALRWARN